MQHSSNTWLPRVKVSTQVICITVLVAVILALAALPFIIVDVSVEMDNLEMKAANGGGITDVA